MMMITDLNDQGLAALATLIEQQRTNTTGPGWDQAGIIGALRTAQGPVDQVLAAGLAAASDPTARTPAAIRWSQYQTRKTPTSEPPANRGPVCRTCTRHREACQRAQRNTGQDFHEFEPLIGPATFAGRT